MGLLHRKTTSGFTLLESLVATAMLGLFLATLFALNSSALQTMRVGKEATTASQVLQQRVESLRIANWHQVTDADWLKANLLNSDASAAAGLRSVTETLTLSPYDSSATAATQIRRASGSSSIVQRNSNLLTENALKVVWTVGYSGAPNNRTYSRQAVAILSKGGVAKW